MMTDEKEFDFLNKEGDNSFLKNKENNTDDISAILNSIGKIVGDEEVFFEENKDEKFFFSKDLQKESSLGKKEEQYNKSLQTDDMLNFENSEEKTKNFEQGNNYENIYMEGFLKKIIQNWLAREGKTLVLKQIEQYVDLYIDGNKQEIDRIIKLSIEKSDYEKIILEYLETNGFKTQIESIIKSKLVEIFKNFVTTEENKI